MEPFFWLLVSPSHVGVKVDTAWSHEIRMFTGEVETAGAQVEVVVEIGRGDAGEVVGDGRLIR